MCLGSKRRPVCPPCIAPIFIRPPSATIEIPTVEAESVSGLAIPASMSAQEARAAFGLARVMRPQQAADVRAEAVAIPAGGAQRGSVDGAQPSRQHDNMTVASAAIDAISSGGQGTTAGGAGGAGGAGRGGGTGGAARQGIPPRGGSTPHAVLAIPKVCYTEKTTCSHCHIRLEVSIQFPSDDIIRSLLKPFPEGLLQ